MNAANGDDRPRWLVLAEVPTAVRVLRAAFGGPSWRHLIKVVATPHLTVPGRLLLVGVEPCRHGVEPCRHRVERCRHHYDGRRGLRIRDASLHFLWLVWWSVWSARRRDSLPWVLRAARSGTWRLVNLARSTVDRDAIRFTADLCAFVLALADGHGVALRAEVARENVRLARIYRLRGFEVVDENARDLLLQRQAAPGARSRPRRPPERAAWRWVLRTGRARSGSWQRRFGTVRGALLDVGSGDSPLSAELATGGIAAVALDPQFAIRSPARAGGAAAVAGVAEALPFRDGVFAVVNAGYALQHVGPVRRAVLETLRVARPDGLVVIHPAWGGHRRQGRLAGLDGVRVLPGRRLPPRRQRPSLVIERASFDSAAGLDSVVRAARPNRLARTLGALAMRVVIRARKSTAAGPGAARCGSSRRGRSRCGS